MIILIFQIISVVIMFTFVMFIHEFGHYLMAKKKKVRVENFSLGFGPEIFGWTKNETRYSLRPFPVGAFVKLAGEDVEEKNGAPDEFYSKKWHERLMIVVAGPAMNYLTAFVIFVFIFSVWGIQYQRPMIKYVEKNLPAYTAGLKAGDEIIGINGKKIQDARIISKVVKTSLNQKIIFSVKRNDKVFDVEIIPVTDSNLKQVRIGILYDILSKPIVVKVGVTGALKESVEDIWFWTVTPLKYLYQKIIFLEAPSEVSGPIGIMQAAFVTTKLGVKVFLNFIAIVSVALGLFNLLPIPLVDGGHIMFFTIEGIFKKPVNKIFLRYANSLGLAFLLTLVVYATYQDIARTRSHFWKQVEQVK